MVPTHAYFLHDHVATVVSADAHLIPLVQPDHPDRSLLSLSIVLRILEDCVGSVRISVDPYQ